MMDFTVGCGGTECTCPCPQSFAELVAPAVDMWRVAIVRLPRSRMIPQTGAALRISRTLLREVSHHLPPFAMCKVFPHADDDGGSGAVDLAGGRRSPLP
jgi:hypothetical protein